MVDGETKALNCLIPIASRSRRRRQGPLAQVARPGSSTHDLALIESAIDTVQHALSDARAEAKITDVALSGMLGGLGDPYTTYLIAASDPRARRRTQGRQLRRHRRVHRQGSEDRARSSSIRSKAIPRSAPACAPAMSIVAVDGKPTAGLDARRRRAPHSRTARHGRRAARETPRRQRARDDPRHARRRFTCRRCARRWRTDSSYVRLSDFGRPRPTRCAPRSSTAKKHGVQRLHPRSAQQRRRLARCGRRHLEPRSSIKARSSRRSTAPATRRAHAPAAARSTPCRSCCSSTRYTASASEITAGARAGRRRRNARRDEDLRQRRRAESLHAARQAARSRSRPRATSRPRAATSSTRASCPTSCVDQRVDLPIIDTPADKQLAAAKKPSIARRDQLMKRTLSRRPRPRARRSRSRTSPPASAAAALSRSSKPTSSTATLHAPDCKTSIRRSIRRAVLDGARTRIIDVSEEAQGIDDPNAVRRCARATTTSNNIRELQREVSTRSRVRLKPSGQSRSRRIEDHLRGDLRRPRLGEGSLHGLLSIRKSMPSSTKASTARRSAASASRTSIDDEEEHAARRERDPRRPVRQGRACAATTRSPRSTASRSSDIIDGATTLDVQQKRVTQTAARRSGHAACGSRSCAAAAARADHDHARDDPAAQRQLAKMLPGRHRLRAALRVRSEDRRANSTPR